MFNFLKSRKRVRAIEISKENFTETLKQNNITLVFFEAPWCGACKMLHPIINELADENREKPITIALVNVDNETELSQQFSIRSLPTLIVFKGAEIIQQGPGMISKPRLQEMIDNLIITI
jgi:thioredoxin 1